MNTTTLFPLIRLKYYEKPPKSYRPNNGLKCFICHEKNVPVGSGFTDEKGKTHIYCERCAIRNFKFHYGFRTLKLAEHRRRRLFDVGYLFNEMLVDKYMAEQCKNDIDQLSHDEREMLLDLSTEKFNLALSKAEKVKLEETVSQIDIEKKLLPIAAKTTIPPVGNWIFNKIVPRHKA